MQRPLRLGILGGGRLARAWLTGLANAASQDVTVVALLVRDAATRAALQGEFAVPAQAPDDPLPEMDVLLFAVVDAAIGERARSLDARLPDSVLFVHGSGNRGAELFAARTGPNAQLHPLRSLQEGEGLEGCPLVTRAGGDVLQVLQRLARAVRAELRVVPELDAELYHAAASLLAGGACALFAEALALFRESSGGAISRQDAWELLQSVVRGLHVQSPETALTGPVARGDLDVVAGHLRRLHARRPELVPLYQELARRMSALVHGASARDALEALFLRVDAEGRDPR